MSIEIRAGARTVHWRDCVIEVHPDHPPRLHKPDGTVEEINPSDVPVMVTVPNIFMVNVPPTDKPDR